MEGLPGILTLICITPTDSKVEVCQHVYQITFFRKSTAPEHLMIQ
jgi:hypothetical protein